MKPLGFEFRALPWDVGDEMWNSLKLVSVILTALLLVACTAVDTALTRTSGESLPIPDTTSAVTAGDARIAPMDTLVVSVFGVESLGGEYQVDFQGRLNLPLIGEVAAAGKTPGELSEELEMRYEKDYLQDPDVNVVIAEAVGRRITVDGSINSPGLYPVTGRVSLLQAVALAGGPARGSNPRKVVVFRQINGERHSGAFNLIAIREGKAEDPEIFGNDIIVVDGSEARRTYGEILETVPLLALFLAF